MGCASLLDCDRDIDSGRLGRERDRTPRPLHTEQRVGARAGEDAVRGRIPGRGEGWCWLGVVRRVGPFRYLYLAIRPVIDRP